MWSMDRVSLPPLFVHYARTQLLPNMSPVVQQEALTIAFGDGQHDPGEDRLEPGCSQPTAEGLGGREAGGPIGP